MAERLIFPKYDAAWNRTGYTAEPQYPGQQHLADGEDFVKCPCGKAMGRFVAFGNRAWCSAGHALDRQKVTIDER